MKPMLAALGVALAAWLAPAAAQDTEVQAPFITTPEEVVERMLALADTRVGEYVIDLGSGDGRIVIMAAKQFGAHGLGLDLDEKLVRISRENASRAGVAGRAAFEVRDVMRADVSRADVVTIYLLPALMRRLQPKLLDEMKPGARIVTHAFAFEGWRPDRTERVRLTRRHEGQGDESTVFLWVVPAQVRGAWHASAADAGGEWRLRIQQNFQEIEIEGSAAGKVIEVSEAGLRGSAITWRGSVEIGGRRVAHRFRGMLADERIAGDLIIEQGGAVRTLPLVFIRAR